MEPMIGVTQAFFRPVAKFNSDEEKLRKAKAVATFFTAARRILSFINQAGISAAEKEALIKCFFHACLACQEEPRIKHDAIARLSGELKNYRMQRPREVKKTKQRQTTAQQNKIIKDCADKQWAKNSKLRASALGTAKAIAKTVKKTLADSNLKSLDVQAIRKRIANFK